MGKEYCVYVHTNKVNGKKYVGITKQKPVTRWANGKGYKENLHFTFAIQKYGWDNFKHEIIKSQLTKEEACKQEFELIKILNTQNPSFGYNVANGGTGVNSVSDRTKDIMRIKTTEYFQNHPEAREHAARKTKEYYQNHPEVKRWKSEELKRFFAEHPEKKSTKRIWQYDINGEYVCEWTSAVEAEKTAGYDRKKISACLTGHQKSACGYLWRYAGNGNPEKIEGITQKQKKPEKQKKYERHTAGVEQYDRNGNWLRSFSSILEATQDTGVGHSCIIRCCKGKGHTAGGYQWRYTTDKAIQLEPKNKWQKFRVAQYDMKGQLINIYKSVKDAEESLGLKHPSKISYVCSGQRKSCNGFIWKYIDKDIQDIISPYQNACEKRVCQYDKSGNIINVYKSATDAENKTGIKRKNIYRVCRGERMSTGGYIWRYANELQNKTI